MIWRPRHAALLALALLVLASPLQAKGGRSKVEAAAAKQRTKIAAVWTKLAEDLVLSAEDVVYKPARSRS